MIVEAASAADLPAILELLKENQLPTDGLSAHIATMLIARENDRDDRIVGSVAIELYTDGGLLRSVAVAPEWHGRGVGRALTEAAFALAAHHGLRTLYLLTTTAERYFPKFGFEPIRRDDVPASVRQSVEFTSACPSTAIVMRGHVDHGGTT